MSIWDLFVPEVNEETGKLYYSNDYLGITIDFWPIVFAGAAVLLLIFLLVNGFLIIPASPDFGYGYDGQLNQLGQLGQLDQLGQLGHGHSHRSSGSPGGGFGSTIDQLHARVHALQAREEELQEVFDSYSWEEPAVIEEPLPNYGS